MWPDDDDEDEFDEVLDEDDDDEEIVARVEAAFREERARIRAATDRGALRELRLTYEEQVADEVLVGVAALRAGDLVELIEGRLVELKAARLRRQRASAEDREGARVHVDLAARDQRERDAAVQRQVTERVRRERMEGERVRRERAAVERKVQERARQAEAEQRAAAARLANAKAAEAEARVALLRAQAARAARSPARSGAPEGVVVPPHRRPSALEQAVTEPVDETDGPVCTSPIEMADREALMAAGHWPPMGPPRDSLFWSPDAGWPKEWTLTGFDLASFRARVGVTQAVMAGKLGVETIEVARAETKPREKVRQALQVSLARAIDEFRAANTSRVVATDGTSSVRPPARTLTGADLARFRQAHGLSQRQAAERLGVAHGTVAKAELHPTQALGERLQQALIAALRQ